MRNQVPDIFPSIQILPILRFRPTGNNYFLLDIKGDPIRDNCVRMTLLQYLFDPIENKIKFVVEKPIEIETEVNVEWFRNEAAQWKQHRGFKNWSQVDFRDIHPNELRALQAVMPDVVSKRRLFEAQKHLGFLKDENFHRAVEVMTSLGPATTADNPEIETDPKVRLIKK